MSDLGELVPAIDAETGFAVDTPRLIDLLLAGVVRFNAIVATPIGLTGTACDRELSPTEQRLLVMLSVLIHIRGEWMQATKNAIVHLNVAGRTDLRTPAVEYKHMVARLAEEMQGVITDLNNAGLIGSGVGIQELGETLRPFGVAYGGWMRV